MQAPLAGSQPMGLQAGSAAAMHWAAQQFPTPKTPQKPEMQELLLVHAPVASWATHWLVAASHE
jgi:hypothetical protein